MMSIVLFGVVFAACTLLTYSAQIMEYDFHKFPKDIVALHMPCEESNVFATKCMCHIRCTDNQCSNAKDVCGKYSSSKGCKYMLLRQIGKGKVATLKRVPREEEMARFDISMYPKTSQQFDESKWKAQAKARSGASIGGLVQKLGSDGQNLVARLFQPVSNSSLCPINQPGRGAGSAETRRSDFLEQGIALAVLSYHAPMTLANTVRTWNSSGLLEMVSERVALLNDPLPQEHAIALQHGFEVLQPNDIPEAKMAKPNVVTIGAAFYYALQHIKSEYLLFLENDFKVDTALSQADIMKQLVTAAGMLYNGAEVIRLMSRKYQGCGTFKTCDHHGTNLASPSHGDRQRNWYTFYCKCHPGTKPYVADCAQDPDFRCFTSWDSSWTLNAVMVKKSTMLGKQYKTLKSGMRSIAEIGLSQHQAQDGFESVMRNMWQPWKVPICISYDGLFMHEEIETGA